MLGFIGNCAPWLSDKAQYEVMFRSLNIFKGSTISLFNDVYLSSDVTVV